MGCTGSRGKHGDGIKPLKIPETIYKYGTDDKDALAPSLKPKFDPEYYKLQCDLYFTHLESGIADRVEFYCASGCPRWEWPPWDCLTGLGFVNIMTADAFDRDETACIVVDRTHKFFDVQPFGRSVVTFYYGDDIKTRKNPIKIYEEFTFNDFGQVTFIEAWSAVKGEYLPVVDDNGWPPEDVPVRLSYHIPGLGSPTGAIDMKGDAMKKAEKEDVYVKDFIERSHHFLFSVAEAHELNKMKKNPLAVQNKVLHQQ